MNITCRVCPIHQLAEANYSDYKEGFGNGLFLQAIQGLSGQMVGAVEGTRAGLNDARIEQIRQDETDNWGKDSAEAAYLNEHPELAKAVHDCELKVQLGSCLIHSLNKID